MKAPLHPNGGLTRSSTAMHRPTRLHLPRPALRCDDVLPAEKTLRFMELERVQKYKQNNRLQRYINKVLKVLVEGKSSRTEHGLTGHSTCHKVVNFEGSRDLLGKIVDVRITEVKVNSLFGEVH